MLYQKHSWELNDQGDVPGMKAVLEFERFATCDVPTFVTCNALKKKDVSVKDGTEEPLILKLHQAMTVCCNKD